MYQMLFQVRKILINNRIPFLDEIDIHINPQEMAVSKKQNENGSPPKNKDPKLKMEVDKIYNFFFFFIKSK